MGSFKVALLEALLSVGIPHDRARAVVELFDRSVDERYGLHAQVIATKRDVAEINAALGRDIAVLETRLSKDIADLETRLSRDIAEIQTRLSKDIASSKVDLVKWVLAALTAQTALLLGAIKLF